MSEKDGGPAFPQPNEQLIDAMVWEAVKHMPEGPERHKAITAERARLVGGMSLRDYAEVAYTAAWIAALAVRRGEPGYSDDGVAMEARRLGAYQARAMLAAREAKQT
jgi:hypothetical protein